MSVRQRSWIDTQGRKKTAWMVDFTFQHADGTRLRVCRISPLNTRRGAEERERQIRTSLLAGSFGVEVKQVSTFTEFSEKFRTHSKTNDKYSTQKTKHYVLTKHLLPAFGKKKLNAITSYDIETFKARKLDKGILPKTINNHLAILSKLLSLAVEWNELGAVPKIVWMRLPKPEFDFLNFEEAERLVAATEPEWRAMVITALHTGLRLGELVALQWDCVDFVGGRLLVRRNGYRGKLGSPKSGRNREVPLSQTVLVALKEHRHLRGPFVFCTPDGKILNAYNRCQYAIARQCRRAGLRPVGWHTLRHTFASHLVMKGIPLKAVQELLGHATIEMTMRYSHLSPEVTRDAVKVLDAGVQHTSNMGGKSALSC